MDAQHLLIELQICQGYPRVITGTSESRALPATKKSIGPTSYSCLNQQQKTIVDQCFFLFSLWVGWSKECLWGGGEERLVQRAPCLSKLFSHAGQGGQNLFFVCFGCCEIHDFGEGRPHAENSHAYHWKAPTFSQNTPPPFGHLQLKLPCATQDLPLNWTTHHKLRNSSLESSFYPKHAPFEARLFILHVSENFSLWSVPGVHHALGQHLKIGEFTKWKFSFFP